MFRKVFIGVLKFIILDKRTMKKINLIFQCKDWEIDWLKDLLSEINFKILFDGKFEIVKNRSIVVTNCKERSKIEEYVSRFLENDYKIGIIHLSDEFFELPNRFYNKVAFVFRNYYHPKFSTHNNVYFFPLGYKKGFWNNKKSYKLKLTLIVAMVK